MNHLGLGACHVHSEGYGLDCVPPKVPCGSPNPQGRKATLFGDRAFKEAGRVNKAHVGENASICCPYKRGFTPTERGQGCAGAEERKRQQERPQGKPSLPTPPPGASSLQNCEKLSVLAGLGGWGCAGVHLRHSVCPGVVCWAVWGGVCREEGVGERAKAENPAPPPAGSTGFGAVP